MVLMMKIEWKKLMICILIPLAVGGLSAVLTKNGMREFMSVSKPALTPPMWLFPVVWTILYIVMGITSYLVLVSGEEQQKVEGALRLYGVHLVVNFFWSIIFFNMQMYLFAFFWLLLLWAFVLLVGLAFYRIRKIAGAPWILYLLWVTFAGYLNWMVYALN